MTICARVRDSFWTALVLIVTFPFVLFVMSKTVSEVYRAVGSTELKRKDNSGLAALAFLSFCILYALLIEVC
jgi:hypothetical protein